MAQSFFIDPTMGRGQGLQGLAEIVRENRQRADEQARIDAEKEQAAQQKAELDTRFVEVLRSGDPLAMAEFAGKNKQYTDALKSQYNLANKKTEGVVRDMSSALMSIDDPIRAADIMQQGSERILQLNGDPVFTMASVEKLRQGDTQELAMVKSVAAGMFPDVAKSMRGETKPAGIVEFERLVEISQGDDPAAAEAAKIKLGQLGRKGQQVDVEAIQEGEEAKARGKVLGRVEAEAETADTVAQTESKIKSAIALAEAEAKNKGEAVTDLNKMQAAMPHLRSRVEELRELSKIATSTMGGRLFDVASKELGFGGTKGATARAKYAAIVSNQVLPLLKATFGGAFTVEEMKTLQSTFGDIDASPEEKMAQLDALIEQKEAELLNKRTAAGVQASDINIESLVQEYAD